LAIRGGGAEELADAIAAVFWAKPAGVESEQTTSPERLDRSGDHAK
jgi:hypothetical protein